VDRQGGQRKGQPEQQSQGVGGRERYEVCATLGAQQVGVCETDVVEVVEPRRDVCVQCRHVFVVPDGRVALAEATGEFDPVGERNALRLVEPADRVEHAQRFPVRRVDRERAERELHAVGERAAGLVGLAGECRHVGVQHLHRRAVGHQHAAPEALAVLVGQADRYQHHARASGRRLQRHARRAGAQPLQVGLVMRKALGKDAGRPARHQAPRQRGEGCSVVARTLTVIHGALDGDGADGGEQEPERRPEETVARGEMDDAPAGGEHEGWIDERVAVVAGEHDRPLPFGRNVLPPRDVNVTEEHAERGADDASDGAISNQQKSKTLIVVR
jgi:hypothetical protein